MPRLSQFLDVRQILDEALASGGGEYTLATHGAAVHWRHRVYRFRKQYVSETGDTKYECFVLPAIPKESCTVVLNINRPAGIFTPKGGRPTKPATDDDLMSVAEALAAKIDKGGIV